MKVETLPGSAPSAVPVRNPRAGEGNEKNAEGSFYAVIDRIAAADESAEPARTTRSSPRQKPAGESGSEAAGAEDASRAKKPDAGSGRPPACSPTERSNPVQAPDGDRGGKQVRGKAESGRAEHSALSSLEGSSGMGVDLSTTDGSSRDQDHSATAPSQNSSPAIPVDAASSSPGIPSVVQGEDVERIAEGAKPAVNETAVGCTRSQVKDAVQGNPVKGSASMRSGGDSGHTAPAALADGQSAGTVDARAVGRSDGLSAESGQTPSALRETFADEKSPTQAGQGTALPEMECMPATVAPAPAIPAQRHGSVLAGPEIPGPGTDATHMQSRSAPEGSPLEPLPARAPDDAETLPVHHPARPMAPPTGSDSAGVTHVSDVVASSHMGNSEALAGQADDSGAVGKDIPFTTEHPPTDFAWSGTKPGPGTDTVVSASEQLRGAPPDTETGTNREARSGVRNGMPHEAAGNVPAPDRDATYPVAEAADGDHLKALSRTRAHLVGLQMREAVRESRPSLRRESVQSLAPANPQAEDGRRATLLPGWERPFVDDSWIVDRGPSMDGDEAATGNLGKSAEPAGGKTARPDAPRSESAENAKVDAGEVPNVPVSGGTLRATASEAPAGRTFQSAVRGDPAASTSWGSGGQIALPMGGSEPKSLASLMTPGHASSPEGADFLMQLAERIQVQLRNGENIIRIQLKPDTLGRLEIRAETSGGAVTATIITESTGVKEVLNHNLHLLQQSFQDQGLKVDRIQVAMQEGFVPQQSAAGHQDPRSGSEPSGGSGNPSWTGETSDWRNEDSVPDAQTLTVLGPHSTFHTIA